MLNPAEEPPLESQPGNEITDEVEVHLHEHFTETVTRILEDTPETLVRGPQTNENPSPIDGLALKYASKGGAERVGTEPLVDSLVDCHPCYFHVGKYGEADYFMIDDLKRKAEVHFRASFMSFRETEPFAETIEELYSTRANYHDLRQVAVEMVVAIRLVNSRFHWSLKLNGYETTLGGRVLTARRKPTIAQLVIIRSLLRVVLGI